MLGVVEWCACSWHSGGWKHSIGPQQGSRCLQPSAEILARLARAGEETGRSRLSWSRADRQAVVHPIPQIGRADGHLGAGICRHFHEEGRQASCLPDDCRRIPRILQVRCERGASHRSAECERLLLCRRTAERVARRQSDAPDLRGPVLSDRSRHVEANGSGRQARSRLRHHDETRGERNGDSVVSLIGNSNPAPTASAVGAVFLLQNFFQFNKSRPFIKVKFYGKM
jgi:hypothetical protein